MLVAAGVGTLVRLLLALFVLIVLYGIAGHSLHALALVQTGALAQTVITGARQELALLAVQPCRGIVLLLPSVLVLACNGVIREMGPAGAVLLALFAQKKSLRSALTNHPAQQSG